MSEYGEPWATAGELIPAIVTSDGRELDLDWDRKEHFPRIIACVNALSGIPNPEAVREVLEAATAVRNDFNHVTLARLYDAVESLSAPFPGAQQK